MVPRLLPLLLFSVSVYADFDYQHSSFHQHHNASAIQPSSSSRHNQNNLDVTDVVLCLCLALGWTIWMLASFVRQDHKLSKQAVLVHGNVRQVVPQDDVQYQAVVDYKVGEIQIRKQFETHQALEPGFANVPVLVLPQEPTRSVLQQDFDQMLYSSQHQELCFRPVVGRRLSILLAGCLVLMSIAGAVLVVEHLDHEARKYGWVVLCVGIPLLLPTALLWHYSAQALASSLQDPEREGIVLKGHMLLKKSLRCEDPIMDAHACDDDYGRLPPRPRPIQTGGCGYFIQLPKRTTRQEQIFSDSSVSDVSSIGSVSIRQQRN